MLAFLFPNVWIYRKYFEVSKILISFHNFVKNVLIFEIPWATPSPGTSAIHIELDIHIFFFSVLIFNCSFSAKVHLRISYLKQTEKSTENKHFSNQTKWSAFFHICYQIKVSRVPLLIGHCYLCREDHLKYAYSPFKCLHLLCLISILHDDMVISISIYRRMYLLW